MLLRVRYLNLGVHLTPSKSLTGVWGRISRYPERGNIKYLGGGRFSHSSSHVLCGGHHHQSPCAHSVTPKTDQSLFWQHPPSQHIPAAHGWIRTKLGDLRPKSWFDLFYIITTLLTAFSHYSMCMFFFCRCLFSILYTEVFVFFNSLTVVMTMAEHEPHDAGLPMRLQTGIAWTAHSKMQGRGRDEL